MILKILISLVFIAMVASMAFGAGYLLRDDARSRRLLVLLKLRIVLTIVLLLLLGYGFFLGGLAN